MKDTMKAAQITKYSKKIKVQVNDIAIPDIADHEVLVQVKAAAVNPLELLILAGSVKLIQDYSFPLTIGNELAGTLEKVGKKVKGFYKGDDIYTRLPVSQIGAFTEYVAVDAAAIARMPAHLTHAEASAVALTGLTAYQGLHEELQVQAGKTVFIAGGSGNFGQIAVPIAKSMGLHVIVSGNTRTRKPILNRGADQYIDYSKENYVDVLSDIDYVIDTLGAKEFDNELRIMKPGGRLLSLRTGPNKRFAEERQLPWWKQQLFAIVGASFDRKAKKKDIEYRFIFVRSEGKQLQEITQIMEKNRILPLLHPQAFTINEVNEALQLVAHGRPQGKVIIHF